MIDLHIHTNHSDGTDSVEEVLKKAEDKKMELISITDHDSIDAYKELENTEIRRTFSGKILPGCEMKTFYKEVPIEVLAYGIDYNKLRIHKIDNEKVQKNILNNMIEIAKSIGLKFDEKNLYIDINDSTRQYAAFILGSELLKYDENKEIIDKIGKFTPSSFFREHQSNKNSVFYYNETHTSIDLHETIKRIHEAGGLAFLAHAYIYPYENKDEVIEEIISIPELDGMECIYPLFSKEQMENAINLCKKHGKYGSGGTDYHAKNKPNIELGTGINQNIGIKKEFIKDWIEKVNFM